MARRKRNESPERQALREMMAGYLKDNPVRDGKDVNSDKSYKKCTISNKRNTNR
ncbi:MAG: hypothetical protein Q4D26_07095 [Clostridia bacterium]|nr:hypothetical protein [Clostridia bacterium]